MENKLAMVLIFGSLLISIRLGLHADTHQPEADDSSLNPNLCVGKEKVTKLRFYLHDIVGGENRTVWSVARSNLSDILPSRFGLVLALDNLITSGPEIHSEKIGRIQGLVGLADFHEIALDMLLNVVFTEGKYKGSTLSILGRNPLVDKTREVSVVAGTGAFRMARGYVITRTHSITEDRTYGIYQYDVVVYHNVC